MNTPPRVPGSQAQFGFLPSPPPLPRIVARAMACCALAQRVEVEPPPGALLDAATLAGIDELLELTLDWLERHGMAQELSSAEHATLQAGAGTLDESALERHADGGEGAAVLAWALRRADLPGFDVDADAATTAAALGWLDDAGIALGSTARLRHRDEIGAYLDAVSAVHWRLRTFASPGGAPEDPPADAPPDADGFLPDAGQIGRTVSMARWQADRFAWPEGVAPVALATDGDLALGGRRLAEVAPAGLLAALRRLRARHRATLWLLGQHRDWDAIDVSL